jgi:hypothetical protein
MSLPKLPTKAGVAVLALGGVSVTLTTETAREWLELLSQYGPLVLSTWLIYVVWQIDQERSQLKVELSYLKVKVAKLEQESRVRCDSEERAAKGAARERQRLRDK